MASCGLGGFWGCCGPDWVVPFAKVRAVSAIPTCPRAGGRRGPSETTIACATLDPRLRGGTVEFRVTAANAVGPYPGEGRASFGELEASPQRRLGSAAAPAACCHREIPAFAGMTSGAIGMDQPRRFPSWAPAFAGVRGGGARGHIRARYPRGGGDSGLDRGSVVCWALDPRLRGGTVLPMGMAPDNARPPRCICLPIGARERQWFP